jgi:hypothetical protein
VDQRPADIYDQLLPHCCGGVQQRQGDGVAEFWGEISARDRADDFSVAQNRGSFSRWASPIKREPTQNPTDALITFSEKSLTTKKIWLVPRDNPTKICLEGADARTEFMTMERKSGFEPQCVASSETGRNHPRVGKRIPQFDTTINRDRKLKSILAGISGTGHDDLGTLPVDRGHSESSNGT